MKFFIYLKYIQIFLIEVSENLLVKKLHNCQNENLLNTFYLKMTTIHFFSLISKLFYTLSFLKNQLVQTFLYLVQKNFKVYFVIF